MSYWSFLLMNSKHCSMDNCYECCFCATPAINSYQSQTKIMHILTAIIIRKHYYIQYTSINSYSMLLTKTPINSRWDQKKFASYKNIYNAFNILCISSKQIW